MSKATISIGTHAGHNVRFHLDVLRTSHLLITGASGAGKSYLMRVLAERLFGVLPIFLIDPEEEYPSLREKFGFVLVGHGGDIPIHIKTAPDLARKLMQLNASAIFNLYEMKVEQQHEWLRAFLSELMNLPRKEWHALAFMLDEAHLWCPEKGEGESVARNEAANLALRGRKRGILNIWGTQRLSVLAKTPAAMLQNILIGRTTLDNDRDRAAKTLGVLKKDREAFFAELKNLKRGLFYAQGVAVSADRVLVEVSEAQTRHPEPGSQKDIAWPTPDQIRKLVPALAAIPVEVEKKEKEQRDLQADVARLTGELAVARQAIAKAQAAQAGAVAPEVLTKFNALTAAVGLLLQMIEKLQLINFMDAVPSETVIQQKLKDITIDFANIWRDSKARQNEIGYVKQELAKASRAVKMILDNSNLGALRLAVSKPLLETKKSDSVATVPVDVSSRPYLAPGIAADDGALPTGEKNVLAAIAQDPKGTSRKQLTLLTRYKKSSRNLYLQRLVAKQLITEEGNGFKATDAGIAALGADFVPLPTGAALLEHWRGKLDAGEKTVLDFIVAALGQEIRREEIDASTGYKRSTRNLYIQRLIAANLVEDVGHGKVKASSLLYG